MVRPVIHSIKHYVQFSIYTSALGAIVNKNIVQSVALDAVDAVDEVAEGSIVKAVYLELWCRAGDTVGTSGQVIVYKTQSDTTPPTAAEMAALGDWNNKRNILYTTMGLFNDQDADAIAVFKGWIKIPKGKQRFGLGDKLKVTSFFPTVDAQLCGFATYKEYS